MSTSAGAKVLPIDRDRYRYKMKDLADATGLDRQGIHFYIQQGLLPPGHKTGRNMAWYTVVNTRQSSKPNHFARRCSSSTCSTVVACTRELDSPHAYFSTARIAASFTFGWFVSPR